MRSTISGCRHSLVLSCHPERSEGPLSVFRQGTALAVPQRTPKYRGFSRWGMFSSALAPVASSPHFHFTLSSRPCIKLSSRAQRGTPLRLSSGHGFSRAATNAKASRLQPLGPVVCFTLSSRAQRGTPLRFSSGHGFSRAATNAKASRLQPLGYVFRFRFTNVAPINPCA